MRLWVRWGVRTLGAPPFLVLILGLATHANPPQRAAYVVGANDGSVTRIDLDTNDVTSNLLTIAGTANRVEVSADLARAAVVHSGSDEVTFLDLDTESVLAVVPLPTGANPWTVEWHDHRAFVSALLHDAVYEIDFTGVVDTIPVGKSPEGMALVDGKLYVANTGFDFGTFDYDPGTVTVLDATDLSPIVTVPVPTNPQECLVAPDGTIHVICTGDFGATTGEIAVLDPATNTVVATLLLDAYPGGGCVSNGRVFLNTTTTSFATEIRGYDTATLGWVWDDTNPLLPSFDFYGNLRATSLGHLAVADFSADLMLLETPENPGSPQAFLTGDGPIDLALVEREDPVAILVSGLRAWESERGVHLAWNATVELDIRSFDVERTMDDVWEAVATGLRVGRHNEWIDESAPTDGLVSYRVVAIGRGGRRIPSVAVSVFRASRSRSDRLALHRVVPNPSRHDARIDFTSARAGWGVLELFDVGGRRVARVDVPIQGGEDSYRWNGRGDDGRPLPGGAYFARLSFEGQTSVARLLRTR